MKEWTVEKTMKFLSIAWGDLGHLVIEPKDTVPEFDILVVPDPVIETDYLKLRDDAKEELRKQKLDALCKMYPNKRIIVTKDGQVFVEK